MREAARGRGECEEGDQRERERRPKEATWKKQGRGRAKREAVFHPLTRSF